MEVVRLILPLFVIIFVGYLLRKTGFARAGFVDELNRLVYFIGLPALLFSETSGIDAGHLAGGVVAVVFPLVVAATAAAGLLLTLPLPGPRRGPVVQAGFRANLAYLGLPIVSTALGEETLGVIALIIAVGVITNTFLSILILGFLRPSSVSAAGAEANRSVPTGPLRAMLRNPLLIAIAAGLLFSAAGWSLPRILEQPIELLARMSLPLILLVLGLSLSFTELGRHFPTAALAAALKLVLMPAIAWIMAGWVFNVPSQAADTLVLMSAMPSAVASQTFAKAFDADSAVSASSVSLTTLLAVVTVPLLMLLL
ncbi:MAG: AEC family transporter [Spirochaetaceae bacterium]